MNRLNHLLDADFLALNIECNGQCCLPGMTCQVSQADIDAWLIAVPRIDPRSPHAAAYVRDYNVVRKIRLAKSDGHLDQVMAHRQAPRGC